MLYKKYKKNAEEDSVNSTETVRRKNKKAEKEVKDAVNES